VQVIRPFVAFALVVAVALAGCTSNCDNAGVSVDNRGNIVVRGENGFISPNSSVLGKVTTWPTPPQGEQNFAFSQGYTLSRDGRGFYLLANTTAHPNLVYRIQLSSGQAEALGSHVKQSSAATAADEGPAGAASRETWIAANNDYVYSVDQEQAAISRAPIAKAAELAPYIAGSKTGLRAPIGVAVDEKGKVCALDSETLFVLCYAPSVSGNVSPIESINTKASLGYGQVDDIAFGRAGQLIVAGTSDPLGKGGFSIAVLDVARRTPRLLRRIGGPNTTLGFPNAIGVDKTGNILVLQGNKKITVFGPEQRGNVAPAFIRNPAISGSNAFRMTIDRGSGDVAILGSDGIAYFPKAANNALSQWPAERRLPFRGWDIAFANGALLTADEFGTPILHSVAQATKASPIGRSNVLNLHDPEFISTDQNGRAYVASTDGVITALPMDPDKMLETRTISFSTPYDRNMDAFAVDSSGYYYLSSSSNNAIIVVGPKGQQSILSGSNTGLNNPMGLAVAQDGTLYVANANSDNILEFPRGASGNVSPRGKIAGAETRLIAPQAIAINSAGNLYVFDGPVVAGGAGAQHYVRVYGLGSNGDVAPLKSYPVQTKCWMNAP
jgi:DNA-binding beta-propeller fold protein YncE